MTRPVIAPAACVLVLCIGAAAGTGAATNTTVTTDIPDWSLSTPDGRRIDFGEQVADGPVVAGFWALWCKPCLKELPRLAELAAVYRDRVTFLAVNTDEPKAVAKVAPYLQGRGWDDLVVLLDTGAYVQQRMQIDILPFLLVYDANGREIYRHIGYKEGDERDLRTVLDKTLRPAPTAAAASDPPARTGVLTTTDRFEYSYAKATRREIFENWLDVSYHFGSFRAGLMLNSQAPGEDGNRRNEVIHRFFEYGGDGWQVRAGHFYGLFGRGLVYNSYEDRTVRVDTRLDGVSASFRSGAFAAKVFSGTPLSQAVDLRGVDVEYAPLAGVLLGVSGLTWSPDTGGGVTDPVDRE